MIFDHIEWDDDNLDHATRPASAAQIEQVIVNARRASRTGTIRIGSCCGRPLTVVAG